MFKIVFSEAYSPEFLGNLEEMLPRLKHLVLQDCHSRM